MSNYQDGYRDGVLARQRRYSDIRTSIARSLSEVVTASADLSITLAEYDSLRASAAAYRRFLKMIDRIEVVQ